MIRGLREHLESGDSTSSRYWSQRNKLPVRLIPKSSINEETRRLKNKNNQSVRGGSMSPVRFRSKIREIKTRSTDSITDSDDSKDTVKSISALTDKIIQFLKQTDSKAILEHLLRLVP